MKFNNVDTEWSPIESQRIEDMLLIVGNYLSYRGISDFRTIWDACSREHHKLCQERNRKYAEDKNDE